jgi:hypothetical protein
VNLKVQPNHSVNMWEAGAVIPSSAIEGGVPEAERLIALGCLAWTSEPVAGYHPVALTAVAEMPDDELTEENLKLRKELAAMKAQLAERDAALATDRERKAAAPRADVNPHDADKTPPPHPVKGDDGKAQANTHQVTAATPVKADAKADDKKGK